MDEFERMALRRLADGDLAARAAFFGGSATGSAASNSKPVSSVEVKIVIGGPSVLRPSLSA